MGKKLSDLTTKRVVIIVLLIMISIPIFDQSTYISNYNTYTFGLSDMLHLYEDELVISTEFDYMWNFLINNNKGESPQLLYMSISIFENSNPHIIKAEGEFDDTKQFRQNELDIVVYPETLSEGDLYMIGYFDNTKQTDLAAGLSIIRTIFVCFVLGAAALIFAKDATDLVVTPIENMIRKINHITRNPLKARQIEEEEAFLFEKMFKEQPKLAREMQERQGYETTTLEKIIVKIGGLLAIGFGQAGSEIIVKNMENNGGIDPMIPGKKIIAIFGFCDIHHFSEVNEILQSEIMVFVNQIAEIVHRGVDKYAGAANKNIGEAFLLVWKFEEKDYTNNKNILQLKKNSKVKNLADLSVIGFAGIMADINTSPEVEFYNNNKELKEKMPNFKVKMGFGLNVGWAIEGAIGSAYKIDASYLSPNVNMAARLEAACKQFHTNCLISEKLYNICSSKIQRELRKIDIVTVKGSVDPISLYSLDVDFRELNVSRKKIIKLTGLEKKSRNYNKNLKREEFLKNVFQGRISTISIFKKRIDIAVMRKCFTKEFFKTYDKGLQLYIKGDWQAAKGIFEQTLNFIDGLVDGPSQTILNYMKNRNYTAPEGWIGIRKLTSK